MVIRSVETLRPSSVTLKCHSQVSLWGGGLIYTPAAHQHLFDATPVSNKLLTRTLRVCVIYRGMPTVSFWAWDARKRKGLGVGLGSVWWLCGRPTG